MELKGINEAMPPPFIQESNQKPPKKSDQVERDGKTGPAERDGTTEQAGQVGTIKEILGKIPKGNEDAIKQLAENLNRFMQDMNYSIQFVPDKESGAVIIKVVDGKGKVIRQIPPDAFAGLSSNMGEGIGLILNKMLE